MEQDLVWFFSGILLITLGILHEIGIYWLQLKHHWYSEKFGKYGFAVHGFQLGGAWIVVGLSLISVFCHMPLYPFHDHFFLKILGILFFLGGLALMGGSAWKLGWRRVMKIRLFATSEPSWVKDGLFYYLQNPMYLGSQMAMFGLALALNSWFLLVYVINMIVLQKLLAHLENHKYEKQV